MTSLPERCTPCRQGDPPLDADTIANYLEQTPHWKVDGHQIVREWTFPDFRAALKAANQVGMIADEQDHHPDIRLHSWNHLELRCWTHTVGGLSLNDFVLARQIDRRLDA